ncbi:hypothetical protein VPH35_116303 [Triticum aestivum]
MTTTHLPPHPPPPQPPLAVLPPTRRRADRTPTSPMPYLIRSMGIPLGEGRGYRVPLPFVFQSFPDLLQRIDSVSPEVLAATREMHWRERARRIMDDALSWSQCTREWREAEEELDPDAGQYSVERRYVQVCKDHINRELLNLAWRIYFEGTWEEKRRMPHPSESPMPFVN